MKERGDIIKHEGTGDAVGNTTYQADFVDWPESTPAKSFKVKQVYEAPKEAMICQSTQRTHYKGNLMKSLDFLKSACSRQTYENYLF